MIGELPIGNFLVIDPSKPYWDHDRLIGDFDTESEAIVEARKYSNGWERPIAIAEITRVYGTVTE